MKRMSKQKNGEANDLSAVAPNYFFSLSHLTESPRRKSFTAILCRVPMFFLQLPLRERKPKTVFALCAAQISIGYHVERASRCLFI